MIHRRWVTALRCVPLCFLALIIWRERPWTVQFAADARWAITATIAATILLNFAVYLPLKAARWRVVLIAPPPFGKVLAATIEGLLANAAIGFGSGDLVRAARVRRPEARSEAGGPPEGKPGEAGPGEAQPPEGQLAVDYACAWAERGAELLALAIVTFVAALVTNLGTLALGFSGLAAAAYFAVLGAGRWLAPRLSRWPRVQRALSSGLQASTPRRVTAMVALSLLGWGCEIVMLLLFQRAFHVEPSFRTAVLTLIGINAAIVIPTLPGNFGTFETGATMALVMCGARPGVAVLYAFTYHLTHVLPLAVVATAVYLYRSRRYMTTPARTSTWR